MWDRPRSPDSEGAFCVHRNQRRCLPSLCLRPLNETPLLTQIKCFPSLHPLKHRFGSTQRETQHFPAGLAGGHGAGGRLPVPDGCAPTPPIGKKVSACGAALAPLRRPRRAEAGGETPVDGAEGKGAPGGRAAVGSGLKGEPRGSASSRFRQPPSRQRGCPRSVHLWAPAAASWQVSSPAAGKTGGVNSAESYLQAAGGGAPRCRHSPGARRSSKAAALR